LALVSRRPVESRTNAKSPATTLAADLQPPAGGRDGQQARGEPDAEPVGRQPGDARRDGARDVAAQARGRDGDGPAHVGDRQHAAERQRDVGDGQLKVLRGRVAGEREVARERLAGDGQLVPVPAAVSPSGETATVTSPANATPVADEPAATYPLNCPLATPLVMVRLADAPVLAPAACRR
jgi:hypothetical protein